MGSDRVLTFEGDGRLQPSTPTPCIITGSGSAGSFCFLKKLRDDDVVAVNDGPLAGRWRTLTQLTKPLFGFATKPDTNTAV